MMKDYIENQMGKASESKSDCVEPKEKGKGKGEGEGEGDNYEYGPESLYSEVLGNID